MAVEQRFLIPPWQNFACTHCGTCCPGPGLRKVLVTQGERARIVQHDWSERVASPFVPLARAPNSPVMELATRADGACVFLDDDLRCSIHRELGYEAKPWMCRAFPLIFTSTPDGVAVTLSHVSTAVLRNLGTPLAEQQEWLRAVFADREAAVLRSAEPLLGLTAPFESNARLAPNLAIGWEGYRALEAAALALLERRERPLESRLLALGALFEGATRAGREGKVAGEAVAAWLAEQTAAEFAPQFAQPPSPRGVSVGRQRAILGLAIALVEQEWVRTQPMERVGQARGVVGAALAVVNAAGTLKLSTLGGEVDLLATRRVAYPREDAPLAEPLERFLKTLIWRKMLLVPSDLRRGYQTLLTIFALVRWYAQAQAARRGGTQVELPDLERAIRAVELAYTGHRLLYRALLQTRGSARLINFLYDRLASPATLTTNFSRPLVAAAAPSPQLN